MKICVVGGGFAGYLAAVSIHRHCANADVSIIDSDREPKNLGFGESGPPDMVRRLIEALAIPPQHEQSWLTDWLVSTRSVMKFNFKWQNFCSTSDRGYYSGLPSVPSYLAVLNPGHGGAIVNQLMSTPDHNSYMLYDIWYELYLKGRRQRQDFQPDINSLYWYCEKNTVPSADGHMLTGLGSVHINSFHAAEWFRKRFGKSINVITDTVQSVHHDSQARILSLTLYSGHEITADIFIDCTGFRRLLGKHFGCEWHVPPSQVMHDSAVIVANGYTDLIQQEIHPYTLGLGMDNGWCFAIPLIDRKSFGYVFDKNFCTADQALEELSRHSNPKTRVTDPLILNWEPGAYKICAKNNWFLLGLASTFVDPFDANLITLQFRQIAAIIKYIKNSNRDVFESYSNLVTTFADSVAERVQFHQCLAPRNTSEYWLRNHDVARKLDLKTQVFHAMQHQNRSSLSVAQGTAIPYLSHLYLSETFYYGMDMSSRCRSSDDRILDLAYNYFVSTNMLNQQRAEIAISLKDWYATHGIKLDDYVKFHTVKDAT